MVKCSEKKQVHKQFEVWNILTNCLTSAYHEMRIMKLSKDILQTLGILCASTKKHIATSLNSMHTNRDW